MKKISRRSLGALILAILLLTGTAVFVVRYAVSAKKWVTFPGSPHVYTDGVLQKGTVQSADGVELLRLEGEKIYSSDVQVRKSFLHLLGDTSGNISSGILKNYAAEMAGFSTVNGVYSAQNVPKTMVISPYSSVQNAAFSALNGRNGTVAVYDYVNGNILCAVSSNSYDPLNVPDIDADKTGKYDGVYVNRFTGSVYVPGSIFKLVTAACALDTFGQEVLQRKFSCDGDLEVGADVVTCGSVHGEISLRDALAKSCNCAFGQLSMDLGADTLQNYVNQMGLTDTYEVDGLQTQAGRFDLTSAQQVDTAWAGIGQYTVMVNPYSFLRFVGALAGSGRAAEPYLVESAGKYRVKPQMFRLNIGEETATILKEFMANNVQTVYGSELFPDLKVCAKSGTAEVGEGQTPHATFAGFLDDPKYPLAFIVVVENGGSGSKTCAPIAGKVLSACISAMDGAK